MIRLLSVGVERYKDAEFGNVRFAEHDATEFASAWRELYGDDCSVSTLLSEQATGGTVHNAITSMAAHSDPRDTVVFYFAGHGLYTGRHLLALTDTYMNALDATAITFETIYTTLRDAHPKKLMLFIDACHSGFELGDHRKVIAKFSAADLLMIDCDSKASVSFASCRQGETSFPYRDENHGCWTYHLLRALRGQVPESLHDGQLLTAMSLQNYLASEVPALVRNLYKGTKAQHPHFFGSLNHDFVVADLGQIIAAQSGDEDFLISNAESVVLVGLETGPIRKLSGFKKGHIVPDDVNLHTQGFVQRIGKKEIRDVQARIYRGLHDKLGIKYSDMKLDESPDGFLIVCPAFDAQASLSQSSDDATQYEITTIVDSLRNPTVLRTPEFTQVFEGFVDQIEVQFKQQVDLAKVVKRLESQNFNGELDYMPDDHISLMLGDLSLEATITREILTVNASDGSLARLLAVASDGLRAISTGAAIGHLTV